jgi:hypothetical protein
VLQLAVSGRCCTHLRVGWGLYCWGALGIPGIQVSLGSVHSPRQGSRGTPSCFAVGESFRLVGEDPCPIPKVTISLENLLPAFCTPNLQFWVSHVGSVKKCLVT